MPDIRVQDEQGTVHVFPDGSTPEMISQALGVKPPASAPNLKTGEGMEAQAQQQAKQVLTGTGNQGNYDATGRKVSGPNGSPLTYMEKAAQAQGDQQTKLGAAQNRASRSPAPFTNAAMAYSPVAAAKGIAGSTVGSKVGGVIGSKLSDSPDAEQYGQLIGGTIGGVGASLPSLSKVQGAASKVLRDPATGKVRTPWQIAVDKLVPDPYAPQSVPAKTIPKGTNYGQYLEDQKGAYQDNQRFDKQAATVARATARNAPKPVPFAEAESAEGVPGTLPKPSGRLIKLPQEFAAEDQLQGIAKNRASQRGMQFAAGMVPGEGRSVPWKPTVTNTTELPPRPLPWETQSPSATRAAPTAAPQFKGGINQKGVEASNVQMSPEDTATSLSTEIGRMNTMLRNSAGRPAEERAALQNQINEYQQRLDELRGPARRLPWAKP